MKRTLLSLISLIGLTASVSAATFTSNVATGNWNAPATWSVVGADADGIPDANDNVTILSTHTITLVAVSDCDDLTIDLGGTLNYNSRNIRIRGNFTRTGTTTNVGGLFFYGNPATITISGNYTNGGNWNFMTGSNVTIAAGATVVKSNYFYVQTNAAITNLSNVLLFGGSVSVTGTGTFTNGATGSISVAFPFLGPIPNFDFTASGNLVRFSGTTTTILRTQYHHLDLQSSSTTTKTWTGGGLNVNGNLRIFAGTTLNCANQDINVGGNWVNFGSINCTNMARVTFDGAGQLIQRTTGTEQFNNLDITSLGTVTLTKPINVAGNLTINIGSLDVGVANNAVAIQGSFVDNGAFTARNGTVTFNGSFPQDIDGFSTTSFYNITSSNGVAVSVLALKQITNILNVTLGSFGTSGAGELILVANSATSSARIAPMGLGTSLFGTGWIIQTYIDGPATAYWQYLSSPTTSSTIADWDGDTRFYMSGVGGNEGNACCPVFRSVRTYNEPTNTYTNVTNTFTALTPGLGFMVWMSDNMTGLTSPLIYDTRGTPNQLNVNRAVTSGGAGGGYNLVGNPYACPVLYTSVVAASSASLNGSFLVLQENGSYATDPNAGTVAAGQGFLCIATTGGNLTFTESCKSTTANPNVLRTIAGNQIRIKAGNEVNGLGEETVVRLNPAGNAAYDGMIDLPYIASPYDNATHIWSQNQDGAQFILNDISTADDHRMIPISVVTSTPGGQILTFKDLNTVTEYNCAWLEDLTTGARINLNETDTYTFDEDQMGAARNFILHLERTNDCVLDLQNSTASLDAQSNVFVSGSQIFAQFDFETEEIVTISMYDLGGRMVMGETTMNVTGETVALTPPDAHGIYLVRIQKGNEITTKKIYY